MDKIEAYETKDLEMINTVLTDEDILPYLTSNYSKKNEKKLLGDEFIIYALCHNDEVIGISVFLDMSMVEDMKYHFAIDIGIIKEKRGKIGLAVAKKMLENFKNKYNWKKIHALVEKKNKASYFFARKCGFKLIHQDENDYFLEIENV